MATPAENLARSLEVLKKLQEIGKVAINTADISRVNRVRLLKNGFLKEVTKGWYISVPVDEKPGDSTSWYASYWSFLAQYLEARYGNDYFISPDQSLLLNTGNWTVPHQLIVRTTANANNHNTPLPHGTSLWNWDSPIPAAAVFVKEQGIRMMDLTSSLVYCTPSVFTYNPSELRTALATVPDASIVNRILLDGGHPIIAGRLAGAFRSIGRVEIAEEIIKTMQAAGYDIRETNPFEKSVPKGLIENERSPYVNRIKLLWFEMRETVISLFPPAPGLPVNKEDYLRNVDEIYTTDAYHSLSIERYRVSPELINRVKSGSWDVLNNEDRRQRDAMAARGYWQASKKVREGIEKILDGNAAGDVADEVYNDWYRELFGPSVIAGIIRASDLSGFRVKQVFISGSRHVPLNNDAVRATMPILFELLKQETEASVRAVLGHFIFVYIHPYMDGNGRMARFLMNLMLASGGYPWTVIPVQNRNEYMQALEKASVERNIEPFAKFIAWLVNETMAGRPVAAK